MTQRAEGQGYGSLVAVVRFEISTKIGRPISLSRICFVDISPKKEMKSTWTFQMDLNLSSIFL